MTAGDRDHGAGRVDAGSRQGDLRRSPEPITDMAGGLGMVISSSLAVGDAGDRDAGAVALASSSATLPANSFSGLSNAFTLASRLARAALVSGFLNAI